MRAALESVWRNKRFFAMQAAGVAGWVALALSWFWLPDSAVWGIALAVAQAIVIVAVAVLLIRAALRFYGRNRITPASGSPPVLQIAATAAAGVALPYALIAWHPELPGIAAQTASVMIRFGLAFLVAVTAYLTIASLLAAARSRSS